MLFRPFERFREISEPPKNTAAKHAETTINAAVLSGFCFRFSSGNRFNVIVRIVDYLDAH